MNVITTALMRTWEEIISIVCQYNGCGILLGLHFGDKIHHYIFVTCFSLAYTNMPTCQKPFKGKL